MTGPDDDGPDPRFEHVGRDVVDRARLRAEGDRPTDRLGVAGDDGSAGRSDSGDCVVCGRWPSRRAPHRRSVVGGVEAAICRDCASLAVSCGADVTDLRSCLGLLALNVERAAQGHDGEVDPLTRSGGPWVDPETGAELNFDVIARAIGKNFAVGSYAAACQCPAHVEARRSVAERRRRVFDDGGMVAPVKGDYTRPEPGLDDVTGLPLAILRTFPDRVIWQGEVRLRKEVVAEVSSALAVETADPGVKPGGLRQRAVAGSTQANARRWTEVHQWERKHGKPFPGIERVGPDRVTLSAADVDTVNRVLDRRPDDFRPFCDWCGELCEGGSGVAERRGSTWCCETCQSSESFRRLGPLVAAILGKTGVVFLDHEGRKCRP